MPFRETAGVYSQNSGEQTLSVDKLQSPFKVKANGKYG
jgi:hypothetical protein